MEMTVWAFPCDKWTHIAHYKDAGCREEDLELCPGGREIKLRRMSTCTSELHDDSEMHKPWCRNIDDLVWREVVDDE